jgi:hypothetical protein
MCPFFAQQSFNCPISFLGLSQQARQEVLEPYSCSLAPSGNQFPKILSPRENFSWAWKPTYSVSHDPDTRFFSLDPKLTRYMYKYRYRYKYKYSKKKLQRKNKIHESRNGGMMEK